MVLARTPMEVGIQYVRMAIARDYSPGGRATLYINKGVDDHWQLFLVWKQTSSPEDSRPGKFLRERLPELATECSSEPDAEARILTVLLSMLSLVCQDTVGFRDQCLRRIGELVSVFCTHHLQPRSYRAETRAKYGLI